MDHIPLRLLRVHKPAQLLGWLYNHLPKQPTPFRTVTTLPPTFPTLPNPFAAPSSPSTDPADQSLFRSLAATWWHPTTMPALHAMNQLRVPLIRDAYIAYHHRGRAGVQRELRESAYPLRGVKILDVGCGGGILSEALVRLGGEVTGIDVVEENVEAARKHWETRRKRDEETAPGTLSYHLSTVESFATLHPAHFDLTIASEVIEHVADTNSFLDGLAALTRPGGTAVFTTINRTLPAFALAIVGAEYVGRFIPRGTHQWSKFIRVEELERKLVQRGLDVRLTQGMGYNPLTNQWSWWRSDAVVYALVAVKNG